MAMLLLDEEEMFRKLAADFAAQELGPKAAEMDRNHTFDRETFQQMVDLGFTGMGIDEEYGGTPCGALAKAIVIEEFAKKCMSSAATLAVHWVVPAILQKFGSLAQKEKYIPMLTTGGKLGAFALTEPNAGTDAGSVRTTAVYDESTDEYVLNGSKCFITGGPRADVAIIFALTEPEKKLKGLSAIIVAKGMPGFDIGKVENKMGLRGSETSELIFTNCRVPAAHLVGEKGKGFKIAMMALDSARIYMGAQAVGVAEEAILLSVKYMHERTQFGKPIGTFQGLQWYIADMATKTEAAKWLVYRAASLKDDGQSYSKEAAMCKLNASENARFVTNLALQIHGGYGYMNDYPLERMYRDAKITEIYEGTSEVQKIVISRAVIGKL